jgi:hypothetical protein
LGGGVTSSARDNPHPVRNKAAVKAARVNHFVEKDIPGILSEIDENKVL